jgi:pyruvate/2-oxoglutarate dehydrogenase complex dihydrolipoamide dehydrogenase (E3) component
LTNAPEEDYDVVLIGGGVAGYVAAIKAGQEGMKVEHLFLIRRHPNAANTPASR